MSAAVPFDPSYQCEEDVRVLMAVEPGLCQLELQLRVFGGISIWTTQARRFSFSVCPDNCTFLCCGASAPGTLINVKQYQSNNHISSNNDKQLGPRVGEEGPAHHSAIHLWLNSLTY